LAVLAVTGASIVIKGFIESDDSEFDLGKALKDALGGGLSGAAAMVLQVFALMPLRTIMNYQYRFGTTLTDAVKILYGDGGWTRYYAGLTAALIQGPVSRFGDTAANKGIRSFLDTNSYTRTLPEALKTACASLVAGIFRMPLTPIDTIKTTYQAQGRDGWTLLKQRIKTNGIGSLWYGAWATVGATFVGHFPWFYVNNWLEESLPLDHNLSQKLLRRAFIGFAASIASDTVSNSLRVVKTYRQVNDVRISYMNAAREVIATDGIRGLFGRGLKTRILANGCQSVMFSILWKWFMDIWEKKTAKS